MSLVKNLFCIYMLLLFPIFSYAQNLISNYSFEKFKSYPTDLKQLYLLDSVWNPSQEDSLHLSASPDFYYKKAKSKYIKPPRTYYGYVKPKSGNSFIGILVYVKRNNFYREYVTIGLKKPLLPDKNYILNLYITNGFEKDTTQELALNLNVCLSKIKPIQFKYYSIDTSLFCSQMLQFNLPHFYNKWHLLSKEFNVSDTVNYITIGNFNKYLTYNYDLIYFFIDDVSIYETKVEEIRCNEMKQSGGYGKHKFVFSIPNKTSYITIEYNMKKIPDKLIIKDNYGNIIYSTKDYVKGKHTEKINVQNLNKLYIYIFGNPKNKNTQWYFRITKCE